MSAESKIKRNRQLLLLAFIAVVVLAFIGIFVSVAIPLAVVYFAVVILLFYAIFKWLDDLIKRRSFRAEPWRPADEQ
ncbi:hypothetical protein M3D57_04510 [Corynebacterium sanguinis]|uniref:hypothetical protein n=1 Tax=Corynebacterium TaxID=1716 RepID=UPI00223C4D93|nr:MULTISPECIES: hypothetical protein [Corynebacterium]MCT1411783.1 hypothetical protein [Corynebacterium sanguinis]MCT1413720.1 hypothetical protein [Corynebacterium sanguinis]MCT1584519.1 hypothetical protein [Corynebacterium sanguinis]MCT2022803.1 hypothetical protein [Corynebacterium sanguinis]MCT2046771.1 hypothetical protein [Corynebacterium sanguinis]